MGFSNKSVLSGVVLVVAVAVLGGAAVAAPIVQTVDFHDVGPQNLQFHKFSYYPQSATGTLTSVDVLLSLTISGGTLEVDNSGAEPATVNVHFGATAMPSSAAVSLSDANGISIFQQAVQAIGNGAFSLSADDGDGIADFTKDALLGSPAYACFSGISKTVNNGGSIGIIDSYRGSGPSDGYVITVDTHQVNDYDAYNGAVHAQIAPLGITGFVTVTYNYTPEPATIGLMLLGGIATFLRRRAA